MGVVAHFVFVTQKELDLFVGQNSSFNTAKRSLKYLDIFSNRLAKES